MVLLRLLGAFLYNVDDGKKTDKQTDTGICADTVEKFMVKQTHFQTLQNSNETRKTNLFAVDDDERIGWINKLKNKLIDCFDDEIIVWNAVFHFQRRRRRRP